MTLGTVAAVDDRARRWLTAGLPHTDEELRAEAPLGSSRTASRGRPRLGLRIVVFTVAVLAVFVMVSVRNTMSAGQTSAYVAVWSGLALIALAPVCLVLASRRRGSERWTWGYLGLVVAWVAGPAFPVPLAVLAVGATWAMLRRTWRVLTGRRSRLVDAGGAPTDSARNVGHSEAVEVDSAAGEVTTPEVVRRNPELE